MKVTLNLPRDFVNRAKILARDSGMRSANAWLANFLQANEPMRMKPTPKLKSKSQ